ncbi:DUF3906 domain-containing protein [Laceyella sacchari]|uniref:DUF3906 domain-containing protein n=1 Tax=Laceyella tengchongensis TaxID=574699 RepID=A0AA46AEW2_9BACL|nr:DUF3906 family protein [Laceyella tengchongensis]AUS09712.1 DUF3906 domain-containing protein [Laceyella sacchari]SMP14925.1 Protein of unknown function [Laceyella tengchongensis]
MSQELYLYRLKAELKDGDTHAVVVLSTGDEQAFTHAEKELERYLIATPDVREWTLEEKKRVRPGSGYVLPSNG